MRNLIHVLAGTFLLATQVASPSLMASTDPTATAPLDSGIVRVAFNQNSANAVAYVPSAQPDFDTEVLVPLRAAQAKAAAEKAATEAAARRAAELRRVALVSAVITGDPVAWMTAAGINPSDFGYVDFIVNHESSWSGTTRWNHAGSGAYGLFQALPGSKMAPYGADWQTNPITQIRWAQGYATARYGSWQGAYEHWLNYHSW